MDLNFIYYFFFFVLGTIVGSFLNVLALRMNTGKSIVNSRSACFNCDKQLAWYELVPILSFLFQRGKCTNCKSSISPQYITVEVITGIVFLLLAGQFIGLALLFYLAVFSILIVIVVYDLRHMIIPDVLSYTFSGLALLFLILSKGSSLLHMPDLLWLLAGPILAFPFAFLWFISRGKWMGFGDAKLALGIGWLLGLTSGITAIMYAFWIGAIVSILMMLLNHDTKHRLSLKSEVPFAPFLILGLAIVFFTHFDLLRELLFGFY